ncbi:MAG TPA: aminotransferase class V-fold PLP-dependent enzyme [Solirubrobacteraceae bacterium]|nr:aminotransferase class V-fold PLP-dependent enzyme [Solirubrobacteraceae bacterium]
MSRPPHPLELIDRERVLELLTQHLGRAWESFDRPRPREPELGPALLERLSGSLPADPGDPEASLADIASVLDASVSPARPLYSAYIGSTGLEAGVLADALANAYDVNLAAAAGAAELLENQTIRWVAEFVGYPVTDGAFTSGGMTSNLTALTAAREHALPGSRFSGVSGRPAAVYCSEESHHSVARAVEVIGLGGEALRRIPIDADRRMRIDALRAALEADRRAGVIPVAVVATSGTTLTGAIDPLAAVADICAEHGVWMHVDGAYGGPAAGVPSLAPNFAGLDRADSLTIDAHKWLGVQKSCSVVMLARQGPLERAFAHDERYMLHAGVAANGVDRTLEYSRPVRSLKLWLVFRIYGADLLRRWIEMTVEHARILARELAAHPRFELLNDPALSVVCFRHLGDGSLAGPQLDAHNLGLARSIMADGRAYLAPAQVDGKTCLRVCFMNFRTTTAQVEEMLDVIEELADRDGPRL